MTHHILFLTRAPLGLDAVRYTGALSVEGAFCIFFRDLVIGYPHLSMTALAKDPSATDQIGAVSVQVSHSLVESILELQTQQIPFGFSGLSNTP